MAQMLDEKIRGQINISKKIGDEVTAAEWKSWRVKLKKKKLEERINEEFILDFTKWLNGKSVYNSSMYDRLVYDATGKVVSREAIDGCPWANMPLTSVPGVTEFLDQGIDRRSETIGYLTKLKMRGPTTLDECYIYYKYIIRELGIDDKACHEVASLAAYDYPPIISPVDGFPSTGGPASAPIPQRHNEQAYWDNWTANYEAIMHEPEKYVQWVVEGAPPAPVDIREDAEPDDDRRRPGNDERGKGRRRNRRQDKRKNKRGAPKTTQLDVTSEGGNFFDGMEEFDVMSESERQQARRADNIQDSLEKSREDSSETETETETEISSSSAENGQRVITYHTLSAEDQDYFLANALIEVSYDAAAKDLSGKGGAAQDGMAPTGQPIFLPRVWADTAQVNGFGAKQLANLEKTLKSGLNGLKEAVEDIATEVSSASAVEIRNLRLAIEAAIDRKNPAAEKETIVYNTTTGRLDPDTEGKWNAQLNLMQESNDLLRDLGKRIKTVEEVIKERPAINKAPKETVLAENEQLNDVNTTLKEIKDILQEQGNVAWNKTLTDSSFQVTVAKTLEDLKQVAGGNGPMLQAMGEILTKMSAEQLLLGDFFSSNFPKEIDRVIRAMPKQVVQTPPSQVFVEGGLSAEQVNFLFSAQQEKHNEVLGKVVEIAEKNGKDTQQILNQFNQYTVRIGEFINQAKENHLPKEIKDIQADVGWMRRIFDDFNTEGIKVKTMPQIAVNAEFYPTIEYKGTISPVIENVTVPAINISPGQFNVSVDPGQIPAPVLNMYGNIEHTGNIIASGEINSSGQVNAGGAISSSGQVVSSGAVNVGGNVISSGQVNASGAVSSTGNVMVPEMKGDVVLQFDPEKVKVPAPQVTVAAPTDQYVDKYEQIKTDITKLGKYVHKQTKEIDSLTKSVSDLTAQLKEKATNPLPQTPNEELKMHQKTIETLLEKLVEKQTDLQEKKNKVIGQAVTAEGYKRAIEKQTGQTIEKTIKEKRERVQKQQQMQEQAAAPEPAQTSFFDKMPEVDRSRMLSKDKSAARRAARAAEGERNAQAKQLLGKKENAKIQTQEAARMKAMTGGMSISEVMEIDDEFAQTLRATKDTAFGLMSQEPKYTTIIDPLTQYLQENGELLKQYEQKVLANTATEAERGEWNKANSLNIVKQTLEKAYKTGSLPQELFNWQSENPQRENFAFGAKETRRKNLETILSKVGMEQKEFIEPVNAVLNRFSAEDGGIDFTSNPYSETQPGVYNFTIDDIRQEMNKRTDLFPSAPQSSADVESYSAFTMALNTVFAKADRGVVGLLQRGPDAANALATFGQEDVYNMAKAIDRRVTPEHAMNAAMTARGIGQLLKSSTLPDFVTNSALFKAAEAGDFNTVQQILTSEFGAAGVPENLNYSLRTRTMLKADTLLRAAKRRVAESFGQTEIPAEINQALASPLDKENISQTNPRALATENASEIKTGIITEALVRARLAFEKAQTEEFRDNDTIQRLVGINTKLREFRMSAYSHDGFSDVMDKMVSGIVNSMGYTFGAAFDENMLSKVDKKQRENIEGIEALIMSREYDAILETAANAGYGTELRVKMLADTVAEDLSGVSTQSKALMTRNVVSDKEMDNVKIWLEAIFNAANPQTEKQNLTNPLLQAIFA